MDCNTPGLPVHHQLPEFTQTHVHQVSDAIQKNLKKEPVDEGDREKWKKKKIGLTISIQTLR